MCQEWRVERRKHIFCSRQCSFEFVKNNNPNYIPCVICGKKTYVKPRDQKKIKAHCCSMECQGIYRSSAYRGKNNPNYGNRGPQNPIWKSDEKISVYGYVLVRCLDHPFANVDGFVFEHRLVAEKYLLNDENSVEIDGKRYLRRDYDVHHIDGDKKNNSLDNLMVLTRGEHMSLHHRNRRRKTS